MELFLIYCQPIIINYCSLIHPSSTEWTKLDAVYNSFLFFNALNSVSADKILWI